MKGWKWGKVLDIVFGIGVVIGLGNGMMRGWEWMTGECVVRTDCRGKGINVEWMIKWEDGEGSPYGNWGMGLNRMAGWRVEEDAEVFSVGTGRKKRSQVIGVYGVMELVEPANVLCGRYGLANEDGYCVVSETLAEALFGSVEVVGEEVMLEGRKLYVAGVIEKQEVVLLLPVREGELEMLAVEVQGRIGAKKKVENIQEYP